MKMPANDSAFWPILRVSLRQAALFVALYFFYDRMDERDAKTITLMLFADLGLTITSFRSKDK